MSPRQEKRSDLWSQVGFYSSLGFIIPAGTVAGYMLGWILDRWLHSGRVVTLILAFLGAAGGLVEVLQILLRAEKRADRDNPDSRPRS